jgi:hypothetical protein
LRNANCAAAVQTAIGATPASAAKRVGRNSVIAPASAAISKTAAITTIIQPPETGLMKSRLMIVSMMLATRSTPAIGVLPNGCG